MYSHFELSKLIIEL